MSQQQTHTRVVAKDLANSNNCKKLLDIEINNLLNDIDSNIRKNNGNNLSNLAYNLPRTFDSVPIHTRDCILLIYGKIIQSYKDRDFDVEIDLCSKSQNKQPILYISWKNEIDSEERQKYLQIISEAIRKGSNEDINLDKH